MIAPIVATATLRGSSTPSSRSVPQPTIIEHSDPKRRGAWRRTLVKPRRWCAKRHGNRSASMPRRCDEWGLESAAWRRLIPFDVDRLRGLGNERAVLVMDLYREHDIEAVVVDEVAAVTVDGFAGHLEHGAD